MADNENVKLVALSTIRRGKLIEAASSTVDPKTGKISVTPAKTEREEIAPGTVFGATEKERDDLVAAGAARVAQSGDLEGESAAIAEQQAVSPATAPRLPDAAGAEPRRRA